MNAAEQEKKSAPRPKPKAPKKAKRIVYFEVEIVDLKTKEKLLLLDKVRVLSSICCFQPFTSSIDHLLKSTNQIFNGGFFRLKTATSRSDTSASHSSRLRLPQTAVTTMKSQGILGSVGRLGGHCCEQSCNFTDNHPPRGGADRQLGVRFKSVAVDW